MPCGVLGNLKLRLIGYGGSLLSSVTVSDDHDTSGSGLRYVPGDYSNFISYFCICTSQILKDKITVIKAKLNQRENHKSKITDL